MRTSFRQPRTRAEPTRPTASPVSPSATRSTTNSDRRPRFAVAAGQVLAGGVAGVAVADGERLFGDLLRGAGVGGLVGDDADHWVTGLVAVQYRGVVTVAVDGDVVPYGDRDHGWPSVWVARRRAWAQPGRRGVARLRAEVITRHPPVPWRPPCCPHLPSGRRFRSAWRPGGTGAVFGGQFGVAELTEVHRLSVVHRDIKPRDLFLTPGGVVKVLDFGVAALLGAGELAKLTMVGQTVGPPYMAPEQALANAVGAPADLYALCPARDAHWQAAVHGDGRHVRPVA